MPHTIGDQVRKVADRVAGPTNARILDLSMVAALVWLAGLVLIFVYLAFKTAKMLDMLSTAKKVRGKRYYVSDDINTSFVLGILRPI